MTILDVQDLQVIFTDDFNQSSIAVDKINFRLRKGETLGIVGESGSGKSVTSLAIMSLLSGKISQGKIWFQEGENSERINLVTATETEKRDYRGGKIAMIFQEPMSSLNPVYNIGFQITEAIRLHQNVSAKEARRKAIYLLQEVKLLPDDHTLIKQFIQQNPQQKNLKDKEIYRQINQQKQAILQRFPHELSGGQLQRVMIAMAISCNPSILIADEPTTALDVTVQATILELLKELCRSRQMSLIFITHDLAVVANIADSLAVMYQGKIVEYGNAREILLNPQQPYTRGLLACRPRLSDNRVYLPTVGDFMSNNRSNWWQIPQKIPQKTINLSHPLLDVEKLKVGFRKQGLSFWQSDYFWAVNNVSFQLFAGETLGLVGESGCGKSTLARAILRLIPVQGGKIEFLGRDLAKYSHKSTNLKRFRRQMQIVFQNPYNSLNPRMSIGDIILEPLQIHKPKLPNNQNYQKRVRYLLRRVGLPSKWYDRYPHELSGGQRQRVCIARALALNPQLIICDESVSALDVSIQAQVLNLLKELQAEFGLTYIFISHDLSVVEFMSDRIIVMNGGKIEEISTSKQIINNPQRDYTKQLIASIPQFPSIA